LIEGAPSCQLLNLLSVFFVENAKSAIIHGQNDSDTVAGWAAGLFEQPEFRVNLLLATTNSGKVRPVLDVSRPVGLSLNSNVIESEIEKVLISS
jgi:hypothetical protein